FLAFGGTVSRRTAFDDVGDVNVFPANAHGGDHVVQQLTGAPDKGLSLLIFVRSGGFANEHEIGSRIACAEDNLLSSLLVQHASGAVADVFADGAQRFFWSHFLACNAWKTCKSRL